MHAAQQASKQPMKPALLGRWREIVRPEAVQLFRFCGLTKANSNRVELFLFRRGLRGEERCVSGCGDIKGLDYWARVQHPHQADRRLIMVQGTCRQRASMQRLEGQILSDFRLLRDG